MSRRNQLMKESNIRLTYVIDDDEVIKYLTELMFKQLDFSEKTEFFMDPVLAFAKLKSLAEKDEQLPDLIFLDLKMPAMDGWCFLNAMSELNLKKEIPVFVFSSSINEDDIIRSKQYVNVKDYIIKPLTVHKVNKILRQLI